MIGDDKSRGPEGIAKKSDHFTTKTDADTRRDCDGDYKLAVLSSGPSQGLSVTVLHMDLSKIVYLERLNDLMVRKREARAMARRDDFCSQDALRILLLLTTYGVTLFIVACIVFIHEHFTLWAVVYMNTHSLPPTFPVAVDER